MSTKHTPGPWVARNNEENCLVYSEKFGGITLCQHNGAHREEHEANARLIAAAPELLEMLDKCAKQLIEMAFHFDGTCEGDVEETVCESTNPARQSIVIARLAKYIIAKATGEKEAI